jgi:hypothetical protein
MPEQNFRERLSGLAVKSLQDRIRSQSAEVGIMGLGYVGLTEAIEFARSGFCVTGFDVDVQRIQNIQVGHSYLVDISDQRLRLDVESGKLRATSDFSLLKEMDAILIAVPTPLSKTKTPDLSYIISAVEAIRPRLREGQLIILESTTYPGTTNEVVLPSLEGTGLKAGSDFHLCFSLGFGQSGCEPKASEPAFESLLGTWHERWLWSRVHPIPGAPEMTTHQGPTGSHRVARLCGTRLSSPPASAPLGSVARPAGGRASPGPTARAWCGRWPGPTPGVGSPAPHGLGLPHR